MPFKLTYFDNGATQLHPMSKSRHSLNVDITLAEGEAAYLKAGKRNKDWVWYADGDTIRFHNAHTGYELYRCRLVDTKILTLTINTDAAERKHGLTESIAEFVDFIHGIGGQLICPN